MRRIAKWAALIVLIAVAFLLFFRGERRVDRPEVNPPRKPIVAKAIVAKRSVAPFAYSMSTAANPAASGATVANGWTAIPSTGDPEQDRQMLRRKNGATIDAMYADMYRLLGFSPEQTAAFRDLLLGRQERVSRLLKLSMHHMAADRTNAALALDVIEQQEQQTYEAALRQTFGDSTAREINTYDSNRRIRLIAGRIANASGPAAGDVEARTQEAIRTVAIAADGEIAMTPANRDRIIAEAKQYLSSAQAQALRTELDRLVTPPASPPPQAPNRG